MLVEEEKTRVLILCDVPRKSLYKIQFGYNFTKHVACVCSLFHLCVLLCVTTNYNVATCVYQSF